MKIGKTRDGLLLESVKVIDLEQAYFWTKEWQEAEAEADRDIAEGNVAGPFDNISDLLKSLKASKS